MWDRIERLEQPKAEALTLEEVKEQCRIDSGDDDAFLKRCIKAAREMIEGPEGYGLAIMAAPWSMSLDSFPAEIRIPMGPVLSIDSITYVDGAGNEQTLPPSAYQWRRGFMEARISPAFGTSWPGTRAQIGAVKVRFVGGYAGTEEEDVDRSMIPESLRVAMLMLIAHWNENRETVNVGNITTELEFSFGHIINQFRVGRIA
ncbi:head-tail connector protein [Aquamicrobium sp. LC103]|uniref:head-tail connector protein n=1 Tax=Aquamicrobium sp. LC103 TaxID=1120658 RepID=UPI00063E7297|nr:head-tail connector protein [Aquamicrobium sp. LC103]TKT78418.1 hypothetical protein XW59_012445 [Aquamicrobium sp. LC103]